MKTLSSPDRLRLVRFACAFAWADLEVNKEEKLFIAALARHFELEPDEIRVVERWLRVPPRPEDLDPMDIPPDQRQMLLDAAFAMLQADGEVNPRELESYLLLEQLVVSIDRAEE